MSTISNTTLEPYSFSKMRFDRGSMIHVPVLIILSLYLVCGLVGNALLGFLLAGPLHNTPASSMYGVMVISQLLQCTVGIPLAIRSVTSSFERYWFQMECKVMRWTLVYFLNFDGLLLLLYNCHRLKLAIQPWHTWSVKPVVMNSIVMSVALLSALPVPFIYTNSQQSNHDLAWVPPRPCQLSGTQMTVALPTIFAVVHLAVLELALGFIALAQRFFTLHRHGLRSAHNAECSSFSSSWFTSVSSSLFTGPRSNLNPDSEHGGLRTQVMSAIDFFLAKSVPDVPVFQDSDFVDPYESTSTSMASSAKASNQADASGSDNFTTLRKILRKISPVPAEKSTKHSLPTFKSSVSSQNGPADKKGSVAEGVVQSRPCATTSDTEADEDNCPILHALTRKFSSIREGANEMTNPSDNLKSAERPLEDKPAPLFSLVSEIPGEQRRESPDNTGNNVALGSFPSRSSLPQSSLMWYRQEILGTKRHLRRVRKSNSTPLIKSQLDTPAQKVQKRSRSFHHKMSAEDHLKSKMRWRTFLADIESTRNRSHASTTFWMSVVFIVCCIPYHVSVAYDVFTFGQNCCVDRYLYLMVVLGQFSFYATPFAFFCIIVFINENIKQELLLLLSRNCKTGVSETFRYRAPRAYTVKNTSDA